MALGIYEKEVKRFLKAATWLVPSDDLMITHLRTLARSLDKQVEEDGAVQSALANTFGVTLRSLEGRKPKVVTADTEEEDEDLSFS